MATAAPDKDAPRPNDVFISYSRKDKEFVRRLDEALTTRGREAWVDWEGIRPTEEFMQAIYRAIEGADTFVFVLTPDSIASEVCGREIAHATTHNKRIIPLVARDVDAKAVPEAVAKLNWIFCREADDFQHATDTLVTALETDLEWVHAHTRLLTRALEWEAKEKNSSFVLRGDDLRAAEQWLTEAGADKERQPTPLQTAYIIASRKAASRRQRIMLGLTSAGLLIAITLAVIAFQQRNLAEERRRLARARELATEARLEISSRDDGLQRSTLLAIESLKSAWTLDGFIACADAIRRLPRRPLIRAAHDRQVLALAFSADGRWLASEDANSLVAIFDTQTQKQITLEMRGSAMISGALAFSPDSRWLASTSEPAALIWDTTTWKLARELPRSHHAGEANRQVTSVAFSPDGKLLVTATHYSPFLDVYDTATWIEAAAWAEATKKEPGQRGAQVAAFSRHGQWLATGGDGLIIWDTATKQKLMRHEKITPWSLAFNADDTVLAVGEQSGRLQLLKVPDDFEPAQHGELSGASGDGGAMSALVFSPRGISLATAGMGRRVARVWNLPLSDGEARAGQPEMALEMPCEASAIVFSPEGDAVLTGNTDGTIATWPLTSGAAVEVIRHNAAVTAVAFDSSGALLVTASDVLRIFRAGAAGWHQVEERKLPSVATALGFSPDRLRLVAVLDNEVHLFSTETWSESLPALEHARSVGGISFSPEGKLIATRTERYCQRAELVAPSRTQVWELATGREVASVTHPEEDYRTIGTLSERRTIQPEASGDTGLATQSSSWKALRVGPSALRSPDGRWSVDHGQLSELPSGRQVDLVKHEDAINDAVFSPDARWLVTASSDRTVRFWPLRSEELRTEATSRVGRNLTFDEWHKFFPDEPYPRTSAELPVHLSLRENAEQASTSPVR